MLHVTGRRHLCRRFHGAVSLFATTTATLSTSSRRRFESGRSSSNDAASGSAATHQPTTAEMRRTLKKQRRRQLRQPTLWLEDDEENDSKQAEAGSMMSAISTSMASFLSAPSLSLWSLHGHDPAAAVNDDAGHVAGADNSQPSRRVPQLVIVGLGNIGDEYEDTRHNIGFKVVRHFLNTLATMPEATLAPTAEASVTPEKQHVPQSDPEWTTNGAGGPLSSTATAATTATLQVDAKLKGETYRRAVVFTTPESAAALAAAAATTETTTAAATPDKGGDKELPSAADAEFVQCVDDYDIVDNFSRRRRARTLTDGVMHPCRDVSLVLPHTLMNRSGVTVSKLMAKQGVRPLRRSKPRPCDDDVLIVYDDFSLPFGRCQFKWGGGANGHNGVADVSRRLRTEKFARLRVGIGSVGGTQATTHGTTGSLPPARYVLNSFTLEEQAELTTTVLPNLTQLLRVYVHRGLVVAAAHGNHMDLRVPLHEQPHMQPSETSSWMSAAGDGTRKKKTLKVKAKSNHKKG